MAFGPAAHAARTRARVSIVAGARPSRRAISAIGSPIDIAVVAAVIDASVRLGPSPPERRGARPLIVARPAGPAGSGLGGVGRGPAARGAPPPLPPFGGG